VSARILTAFAVLATLIVPCTAHAAFPGTNGKIAFESDRDGYTGIRVMDPDGSGVTNLFADFSIDPAWSADGTRLAFASMRDGNFEIYVMNADGSGQQRITNNPAADLQPAWSPDGSHIAFSSTRDGNLDVYVMDAGGGSQANLTHNSAYDGEPVWSPDGDQIAFDSLRAGAEMDVFLMNPDGSGVVNLTNDPAFDAQPAWSPDGQRLTFISARDQHASGEIYVMTADGSDPTPLTNNLRPEVNLAWSPDGTRIAFDALVTNSEIFTMSAAGGDEVRLTNDPAFDADPDWQPIPAPNLPPDCSQVTADRLSLWPPNHQFRPVALRGASDPDGDPVTLEITGVTQDEPVRGPNDRKAPDARVTSSPERVRLRAERDPRADGRVYTISFTVSDGNGGECEGTARVAVPRHPSRPAVDSAPPAYDSFGH
jgi:TolB protein